MPKKKISYEIPVSAKSSYRHEIVAKWLLRAPIVGALDTIEMFDEKFLALGLGTSSQINGRLYSMSERTVSSIDFFDVSRRLQRQGLGERLLKAYCVEARANGARDLWSDSVSSQALGLRAKVFGLENLHFYDNEYPQYGFLPLSLDQAFATNTRINQLDTIDPDRRAPQSHIGVYVNLEQIDMHDWEQPQVVQISEPIIVV